MSGGTPAQKVPFELGRWELLKFLSASQEEKVAGQSELFPLWRYHPVFTDSPFTLVQAEEQHRDHAIVEQVLADLNSGPLAHMPSEPSPPTPRGLRWPASRTTPARNQDKPQY